MSKSKVKRLTTQIEGYQEHHFKNIEDVGIAWCDNRVWVCFNGASVFRAKVQPDGTLLISFDPPADVNNRL